ncbi:MAG: hypothetical protein ACI9BK_003511, partial [Acidimicrobiales bacterium]
PVQRSQLEQRLDWWIVEVEQNERTIFRHTPTVVR